MHGEPGFLGDHMAVQDTTSNEDTVVPVTVHVSLFDIRRNRVRWMVLGLISVMFTITAMDKSNISAAAPLISREFGLDKSSMGLIFGAFGIAAAIGQVPAGWLADRFGARRMLALCVAGWSVLTVLTAFSSGVAALWLMRFLTGLGESGAYPGATRAVRPWFSRGERGFVQGAPHLFSRFGNAIVPLLVVTLSMSFGWRGAFYVFGAIGLIWAALFFWIYRDRPSTHPWMRADERGQVLLVEREQAGERPAARRAVPWATIMSSRTIWGLIIAAAAYTYTIFFFLTWLPTYLVEYRHFSIAHMGLFASLPLIAGMAGDVAGGLLTDRILLATGRLSLARKVVVVPAFLATAAALIPAALVQDPYASVIWLSTALFFLEVMTGPWWAVPIDVGGEFSGTVAGIMNTSSNIGGALSPVIFGLWAQQGNWTAPFFATAAILVAGAVVWVFLIDPTRSVLDGRPAG
jgi:sugar phosphate permease